MTLQLQLVVLRLTTVMIHGFEVPTRARHLFTQQVAALVDQCLKIKI
jgi:hypothetical protein